MNIKIISIHLFFVIQAFTFANCNQFTTESNSSKLVSNCIDTIMSSAFLVDFNSEFVHIIPTKYIYLEDVNACFRADNFSIGFQVQNLKYQEIIAKKLDKINFQEYTHRNMQLCIEQKIKIAPIKIVFIETPSVWRYQDGGVRKKYHCFTFNFNISEINEMPIISIMDTRPVEVLEIEPFMY